MIVKAQQICTDAMRLAGYIAGGKTPSSADSNICFSELTGMIDIWHTEKLMNVNIESVPVSLGSGLIRIGNDPSYEIQRDYVPISVNAINVNFGGNVIPLLQVQSEQLVRSTTDITTPVGCPTMYRYEPAGDFGSLYLYPPPVSPLNCILSLENGLKLPSALTEDMVLTSGWYQMIKYCLADLIIIPLGVPQDAITQSIREKASAYKDRIKATRTRVTPVSRMDSGVGSYGRGYKRTNINGNGGY